MDLLHFCWHFIVYYFIAFLTIITGVDCDYVQYLSYFYLLFLSVVIAVLFIIVILYSLLYYFRYRIVRVKEDRHVA
uniref:6b protein n=1 Tax=Infectious bronchitis virus TaxID=11120 RepID=A0A1X9Y2Y8_9GAMC|nr:6b protein [Infectious bronchitis virus]